MAISTVEEKEIPEHYSVFSVTKGYSPAFTAGSDVVVKAGHHPKCRLVDVMVLPIVYGAASTIIVEDGDGNDASVVATTAVVNTIVKGEIIESQVFERNESINILSTKGGATDVMLVTLMFESVH